MIKGNPKRFPFIYVQIHQTRETIRNAQRISLLKKLGTDYGAKHFAIEH